MTDQVDSRKRGREEVELCGNPGDDVDVAKAGFKWENLEYHLTYRGWIALELLKAAVLAAFPQSSIVAFSLVHEESDGEVPYKHSHFYFKLDRKSGRRGARLMDIDGVHPHVRKVTKTGHNARLMDYYHKKQKDAYLVQYGREAIQTNGERERQRWQSIRDLSKVGKVDDVLNEYPAEYFRCSRSIQEVSLHGGASAPKLKLLRVGRFFWFYGVPNTGKTTRALDMARRAYPGEEPYTMFASMKYVQGYRYQKAFIVEEASPDNCEGRAAFYKLLMALEPTQVDVKNSYQVIRPEMVVVTSNYHPSECFTSRIPGRASVDCQAILARCKVMRFTKVYCDKKPFDDDFAAAEFKDDEGIVPE